MKRHDLVQIHRTCDVCMIIKSSQKKLWSENSGQRYHESPTIHSGPASFHSASKTWIPIQKLLEQLSRKILRTSSSKFNPCSIPRSLDMYRDRVIIVVPQTSFQFHFVCIIPESLYLIASFGILQW